MNQAQRPKIDVINGLRGYAILAVLWHHLFGKITGPGFGAVEFAGIQWLPFSPLANGGLGVNLFFLLSGFVLALPFFRDAQRQRPDWVETRVFLIRRAKRLLPLFYINALVCLVFFSLNASSIGSVIKQAFWLLTFGFSFTWDYWFPKPNFVLWSLGLEFWFSVLFPLILLAVARFGIWRTFAVVLIVALATRIVGVGYVTDWNPYLNPVKDSLLGRLDDFLWGMVVCHCWLNRRNPNPGSAQAFAWFAVGVVLLLLASNLWDYVVLGSLPTALMAWINLILDAGFACLIWALLTMPKNPLRWLFSNWFVQVMGLMCFSVYVWHGVLQIAIVKEHALLNILFYLAVMLALSALSYRYIEFGSERDWRKLFLLQSRKR